MRIRESDQRQTVLAMHEQEINQDQSKPSYQKLKTMVKRSSGHEIIKPETKELKQEYWLRLRGKNVSVERKSGAISGKEKDRCLQLPTRQ